MWCLSTLKIIVLFATIIQQTFSACTTTYVTFCDNLNDLNNPNYDIEQWTDLVVGDPAIPTEMIEIDFYKIQLENLEKLVSYTIIGKIKDIRSYTFSIHPDDSWLDNVKLYGNNIRRLKANSFDSINLRRLSLTHNRIEYIHRQAFYNCEIVTIDLSNNELESIEADVFSEQYLNNATQELYFKNNKIRVIEPGSLPNSLTLLNLANNKISTLPYNMFDSLVLLEELVLSNNLLKSLPKMDGLTNVEIVDFSHNQIVSLPKDMFTPLENLLIMDFSYNNLSSELALATFNLAEQHPPLQVSLAFNRFTNLQLSDQFENIHYHIFYFYGNPWNCKSWGEIETYMRTNRFKRNQCDLDYFGKGNIPYCIHEPVVLHKHITEEELAAFLKPVYRHKGAIKCKLTPRYL